MGILYWILTIVGIIIFIIVILSLIKVKDDEDGENIIKNIFDACCRRIGIKK